MTDETENDDVRPETNVVDMDAARTARALRRPTNDDARAEQTAAVRAAWRQLGEIFAEEPWRRELVYKIMEVDDEIQPVLDPKHTANFRILLGHHPDMIGKIRVNDFSAQLEAHGLPWDADKKPREMDDTDATMLREWLQRQSVQPTKVETFDAMCVVGLNNRYHPVADYLNSLEWDGVPRIQRWLPTYLGAADNDWARLVGPKFLIAAVARIMKPGCKMDTVMVLEGKQGLKKSTALKVLAGEEWFTESATLFQKHAEAVMSMMGAWILELAEFVAVRRQEHGMVKALITTTTDKVRLPYDRLQKQFPRQCVYAATVNDEDGYLTDPTGNRRFWPVAVAVGDGKIDIEKLAADRDMLWAEAVVQYRLGARWWLEADEEDAAIEQVVDREEVDPWIAALSNDEWLASQTNITSNDALERLHIDVKDMTRSNQMRASQCLRKLGWEKRKMHWAGKTQIRWVRDERTTTDDRF